MKLSISMLIVSLVLALSAPAVAQEQEDASRTAARVLAEAGGALYLQGRYAEALKKLDDAYLILRVPTLGFYSGRCMEELGRWVEAADRYKRVAELEVPEHNADVHQKAKADAAAARAALLPRIPRLRIEITNASPAEVLVSIDGRSRTGDGVTGPVLLDPGEHVVSAQRGDDRLERTVKLEEGLETRVELPFKPKAAEPMPPPGPGNQPPELGLPPESSPPPAGLRTVGFVALGVGGAALIAGAVTGGILLSKKSTLDDECVQDECRALSTSDVKTYSVLRPTTTVLLAAGGAVAAGGLLMVLLSPEPTTTGATPLLGPTWIGVRGRF